MMSLMSLEFLSLGLNIIVDKDDLGLQKTNQKTKKYSTLLFSLTSTEHQIC